MQMIHSNKNIKAKVFTFVDDGLPDLRGKVSASVSLTGSDNESIQSADTRKDENKFSFFTNFLYWNNETNHLSTNNFDNSYFRAIVDMGEDAVPLIYEQIRKSPSPIVKALDYIYPDYAQYEGVLTLKEVCDAWIIILQSIGKA